MATIENLRERVRVRLEETTAAVWTDTEIDECVTGALENYSWLFPDEAISTADVADGALTVPVPVGTIRVQRVILADRSIVPRRSAPVRATGNEELAWEIHSGLIHLTQELSAQTITIWHTTPVTFDTLPAADEGLIVLGAVVQALEARAIQDYKRGGQLSSATSDTVVSNARDDFERALARRSRRIRSTSVAGS